MDEAKCNALTAKHSVIVSLIADIVRETMNGQPEIVSLNVSRGVSDLLQESEAASELLTVIDEALRSWVSGREEEICDRTAKALVNYLSTEEGAK